MKRKYVVFILLAMLAVILGAVGYIQATSIYVNGNIEPLKGITVVIDVGHGGQDPGKVGINGENEAELNLAIARKLKQTIEVMGGVAVLTRDDAQGLYEEGQAWSKADDMRIRREKIAASGADIMISVHVDAFMEDRSVAGSTVLYYGKSEGAEELALAINERLAIIDLDGRQREIKERSNLYILKENPMPGVIVECGFISNEAEEACLNDEGYQAKLALAIARGLADYLSGEK